MAHGKVICMRPELQHVDAPVIICVITCGSCYHMCDNMCKLSFLYVCIQQQHVGIL